MLLLDDPGQEWVLSLRPAPFLVYINSFVFVASFTFRRLNTSVTMATWLFSSVVSFVLVLLVIISVVKLESFADEDTDRPRDINDPQPFRVNKLNVMWDRAKQVNTSYPAFPYGVSAKQLIDLNPMHCSCRIKLCTYTHMNINYTEVIPNSYVLVVY